MNRMKQLAVIALVFGAAQAACAHESGAGTQAAPAASAQTAAQVPAGATSRELVVDVKRTSQLVKSAGGSAQINTDAYSTTTEYI